MTDGSVIQYKLVYSLNFIYIRVVVIDSSVIQYLVYFTLFTERECTDLKNKCFSSDFIQSFTLYTMYTQCLN